MAHESVQDYRDVYMQSSTTNPEYEFQIEDNPGPGRKQYLDKSAENKGSSKMLCYHRGGV